MYSNNSKHDIYIIDNIPTVFAWCSDVDTRRLIPLAVYRTGQSFMKLLKLSLRYGLSSCLR